MAEASVGIRITLNDSASLGLSGLNANLLGLAGSTRGLAGWFNNLSPTMKALGVTAVVSGIAFKALFGLLEGSIKAAADFQTAMLQLKQSVDGASGNVQALANLIVDLGAKTIYSSQQITDAFVQIGVHGFTAQDILAGIGEQSVFLAQAMGETGAADAASLLSSALKMFGGTAQDATQFADDLLFAFRHGVNDISDLNVAMQQAGAQAALMKIPFGEFTAALSFLGEAGMSGSRAGTSLRFMLASLADPTNKAQMELSDLGVVVINKTSPALSQLETAARNSGKAGALLADNFDGTMGALSRMFTQAQKINGLHTDETFFQWATKTGLLSDKLYDANGNFIGIAGAIKQIGQAIENAPDQQKVAALQQLFAVRAGQGANEFLQNLPAALKALQDFQTQQANTSASEAATQKHNTEAGALQGLKTRWTDVKAAIGGTDLGPITGMTNSLNNALGGLFHSTANGTLVLNGAGNAFVNVATLLSGLIFAGSGGAFAFKELEKPLHGVGKGFLSILSPLRVFGDMSGSVSTTIEKFGGPFGVLMRGIEITTRGILGFPGALKKATGAFLDLATDGIEKGMVWLVSGGFNTALAGLGRSFLGLIPATISFGASLIPILLPILLIVGAITIVVLLFTKFRTQGQQLVAFFQSVFGPIIQNVMGTFHKTVDDIGKKWKEVEPQVEKAINQLVQAIMSCRPVFELIGTIIGFVIRLIITVVGNLVTSFLSALPQVIGVFTGIFNIISGVAKLVIAIFTGKWGEIPGILLGILGSVKDTVFNGLGAVLTFVTSFLGKLPQNFKDAGLGIIGGLLQGLNDNAGRVLGWLKGLVNGMLSALHIPFQISSPSKTMAELGKNISLGLVQGMASVNVTQAAGQHFSGILNSTTGLRGNAFAFGAGVSASAANASAAAGTVHNHFEVDGRELFDVVQDRMGHILRMNGAGRKMR